ncbi:helix-turn-helix domain-containing protein [Streptosporangium sp. NPDC004631]
MPGIHVKLSIPPGAIDVQIAARAARWIENRLRRHPGEAAVPLTVGSGDEEALILPREAVNLLACALTQVAEGRGVSVIASHTELTTQQAADILNVSRPYLIGLLESGAIPYRLVGKHRRITAEDLMKYTHRR